MALDAKVLALAQAIGADIKALSAGGGGGGSTPGWELIASSSSISSGITFSSIPAAYSDLLVVIDDVTPSASGNIGIELSHNGSSFTPRISIGGNVTAAQTCHVLIQGYQLGVVSVGIRNLTSAGAANSLAPATNTRDMVSRMSGAVNTVRLTPSAVTLTGTIALYGRI